MKNIEDWECPYCNEFNKINLDNFNINEFREIKCNHCDGEVIIKIYIDLLMSLIKFLRNDFILLIKKAFKTKIEEDEIMRPFKEGDVVVHCNWGRGIVLGEQFQDCDETAIKVEFENETDYGNVVDVSVGLLELIQVK